MACPAFSRSLQQVTHVGITEFEALCLAYRKICYQCFSWDTSLCASWLHFRLRCISFPALTSKIGSLVLVYHKSFFAANSSPQFTQVTCNKFLACVQRQKINSSNIKQKYDPSKLYKPRRIRYTDPSAHKYSEVTKKLPGCTVFITFAQYVPPNRIIMKGWSYN